MKVGLSTIRAHYLEYLHEKAAYEAEADENTAKMQAAVGSAPAAPLLQKSKTIMINPETNDELKILDKAIEFEKNENDEHEEFKWDAPEE